MLQPCSSWAPKKSALLEDVQGDNGPGNIVSVTFLFGPLLFSELQCYAVLSCCWAIGSLHLPSGVKQCQYNRDNPDHSGSIASQLALGACNKLQPSSVLSAATGAAEPPKAHTCKESEWLHAKLGTCSTTICCTGTHWTPAS